MRTLLLSFALLFVAGLAFAQAGSVGVFGDPVGVTCNLSDSPVGLKLYYVVHVYTTGATAAQYRAKLPTCMTQAGGTWLSDTNVFAVTVGNSQIGVSMGYGSCRVGQIHLQTINVFVTGQTPPCCYWYVDGDPYSPSGNIEAVDCGYNLMYPTGGKGIFNALPHCNCNVPAEETTWGGVKALYGE